MASSSFITAPGGANRPISGRAGGYTSGAATGAVAGATVGSVVPVIGTAVGAAVGAVVGAAAGWLGGAQADKAQYYKKLASKWQTLGKEREAAINIRDQLRSFRMQRAAAMMSIGGEEGANRSSAPQGAVASLQSQYAFNAAYTEGQVTIDRTAAKFMRKAGKSMAAANTTFAYLDAAASLATTWSGLATPKPASSPSSGVSQYGPFSGGYQFPKG